MAKKVFPIVEITLDKIVGGGQALGTLEDGRKMFVWNALPGETLRAQMTKKKSSYAEGIAVEIIKRSRERVEPRDPESYLSTSPWQMMNFEAEQHYKAALIEEAFELHDIVLPKFIDVYSDDVEYGYRNKVEFSWYSDTTEGRDTLDLAFFRRGSKGKITLDGTSLAKPEINECARKVRDVLHAKHVTARSLKTLMIRCDQQGNCVWQLYVKDRDIALTDEEFSGTGAQGGEIIYSDPRSPASRITERLQSFGNIVLEDSVLDVPFRYATEGFFQVNIPIYEQALRDMQQFVEPGKPVIDLYSGVGSIGLTIGGNDVTLIEIDEHAVREMRENVQRLDRQADIVHASAETALEHLSADATIIVDPPRAGLHTAVVEKLLELKPARIIYLSCNPVTQARDVALLAAETYGIRYHRGYNFFPRTPHIEHLVVFDLK